MKVIYKNILYKCLIYMLIIFLVNNCSGRISNHGVLNIEKHMNGPLSYILQLLLQNSKTNLQGKLK